MIKYFKIFKKGLILMTEDEKKKKQVQYVAKWDAENCKKVTIKMRKADYEIFNKYVTDNGFSKNGYIISLIKKDLQEKGLMDSDNA